MARDPGMDEELVFVDQIESVQFGRKLTATEEHAGRGRVLEPLYPDAQVAIDVSAMGPWEVRSGRRHDIFRLRLELNRPLAYRLRRFHVATGNRWPVALHHLVSDAAPEHRPVLVHEAGEENMRLIVGNPLLVVDTAVQGDVDAKGQESHVTSVSPHTLPCPAAQSRLTLA